MKRTVQSGRLYPFLITALMLSTFAGAQVTYCPDASTKTNVKLATSGWMFDNAELTVKDTNLSQAQAAANFFQTLKAAGLDTYVALVPGRALANSNKTAGLTFEQQKAITAYKASISGFQQLSVTPINLLSTLSSEKYWFPRDVHWTADGAAASADQIARTVKSGAAYPKQTQTSFALKPLQTGKWRQGWEDAVAKVCGGAAIDVPFNRYSAEQKDAALLDDAVPAFALAGTSYSGFSLNNLLETKLQLSGVDYSVSGGAGLAGLEQFLLASQDQSQHPAILIWELPDRYLSQLNDQGAFRQLTGLAQLAFTRPVALEKQSIRLNGISEKTINIRAEQGSLLSFKLGDLSAVAFKIKLTYKDGSGENIIISRPDRVKNTGLFALPAAPGKAITQATLTFPKPVTTTLNAQVY